jgi:hypothetical protein
VRLAGEELVRIWQPYLRGAKRTFETGCRLDYQVNALKQIDWRNFRLAGGQQAPPNSRHVLPRTT